jgi:RNA polymerase sigma factor (sigma-70 family)
VEASALQAPAGLARARISVGVPLLRLRSDDQLLALFRAGNEDAFRVIHDRYRQRLFAYTRQMLPGSAQDAEDALQDVFVRAYSGLRANRRELALRPWLYRVAHNRCVDELRRPIPPPPAVLQHSVPPPHDPIAQVEQRESLRRLIADLRRLPAQQRSALLMRELGGMTYAEVAAAMDVSVPAVKSLLVRARIGLALASEARDTACVTIRDELTLAHDRGVRCSGTVRRHVTDCGGCREFQTQLRRSRRQFAALTPTLGPIGVIANLLGLGGGAAGGGAGAAATGGATATTGAVIGGGTAASVGTLGAGATHVATLIAAAVVTAGGAVAVQHSIAPAHHHHALPTLAAVAPTFTPAAVQAPAQAGATYAAPASTPSAPVSSKSAGVKSTGTTTTAGGAPTSTTPASISGGDNIVPTASAPSGATDQAGTGSAGATASNATVTSTGATGTAGATGTSGTGTAGTSGSTGTPSSSTGTSSTTGTTGTTSSTTGTSSSTGTGDTGATTSGLGSTTSAGTGSTAPPPTGP